MGLDWGAFSYFLDHPWNRAADVLFLQDDMEPLDGFWEEMAAIPYNQAFIFRDEAEYAVAYSNGRAHFAPRPSWSEEPPEGCFDHNAGIRTFTSRVKRIGVAHPALRVNQQVYSTNVHLGQRGRIER